MRYFWRIMRSRWFNSVLGVLLLAVLVWFFGPLFGIGQLHPLDSEIARILTICALLVLWVVANLLRMVHARKKEEALARGVVASEPDPAETASAEEVALLSERLREAMQTLRRAKLGGKSRGRLYQLPWYMFIGPPGAGKTTALQNCGLTFPLADKSGSAALRGVGGTRNCDWWFTDQAVLIDTAGRYTTQDSQAEVDSRAWLGFLRMLKKHRRRQPLNGVLVAISLSDLALLSEADRAAHARAVRKRVRELADELGVRVPIYVLFTKADMLSGFVEFFDNLGKQEREQVWGMTFALDDGQSEDGAVAAFETEFDALTTRLNERMIERVHQETDIQRRRLIYGFPQQVASLRTVASEFLRDAFRPSRLETRPLLRGVYLTSGTQDGTPIDRLLSAMSGQFGLPRQNIAAFSGAGRSYFLSRLVREVVFGEAALVSADPKVERRARWIHRGAYATAALVLVLVTGFWANSYVGNSGMIAQVHAESLTYNAQLAELAKLGPNDVSLPPVVPVLDTLRGVRGGYNDQENEPPIELTFGLYQGQKLSAASVDAYFRALDGLLIPRLLARLETQMQAQIGKPEVLYQALKVYLILGRQGPLDRDLVLQWMAADFSASLPGEDRAPLRESLLEHLEARLKRPLTALALNGPLITQVRGVLTREPLAEYSYNRIVRSARVQALPPWTVAENGGPGSGRVFALRSGKPLTNGVPGIYTWQGYHSVMLPLLPTVTQDIADDGWVLGRTGKTGVVGTIADVNKLRRDVLGLYLDDYARRWDAMIADITVQPFTTVQEALDQLSLMSAPASPFRDLLLSIDEQTQLSRPAATDNAAAKLEGKAVKVGQKAAGFALLEARTGLSFKQNELANVMGAAFGTTEGGKPVDPATRVDEHFKWVHDFVFAPEGRPKPPMEVAIQKMAALYQSFNQTASAPNQGAALLGSAASSAGGASPAAQLDALSKDMPKPIAGMLQAVAKSSSGVTASGASQELGDAWKSKVLPLCLAAFQRYPFLTASPDPVPPDDFARLLGPGGLMDQFFDQYLKSFVDQTASPWKWQGTDKTPLSLSADSLVEFERAAQIRDSLFSGGPTMKVRFQLTPQRLDPQIAQISLDVGGKTLTYSNGPIEPMQFEWPGPGGKTQVRLTMTPAGGAQGNVSTYDDPWALLRLLDAARMVPSGRPDKFQLVFTSKGGEMAIFELSASSVRNPFTGTLRSFRCPAKL